MSAREPYASPDRGPAGEGATLTSTGGPGAPQSLPNDGPVSEWLTIGLASLAALNCRVPILSVGPLLPLLTDDLGLSATSAGALTALPLLLMGLLSIPAGVVVDRVGPRRTLAATQLLIVFAGAARALTGDAVGMFLATAALGAGVGLAQPAFAQVARGARRVGSSLATALYSNGFTMGGLAATAITAPVLLPAFGQSWRAALLFWAATGGLAAAGWLVLALRERRAPAPRVSTVPPLGKVLKTPGLAAVTWLFTVQSIIFYALTSWVPTVYASHGWPVESAAFPLVALQLTSVVSALSAPLLSVRWLGLRRALLLGAIVGTLGMAGFALAPVAAPYLWGGLTGAGVSLVFVLTLAGPALLAPAERVGATTGVMMALGYLGSFAGPFTLGALRDLTGSFVPGLTLLAALCATMVLVARTLPAVLDRHAALGS